MKRVLTLLFLLATVAAKAQIAFTTANSQTGIIKSDQNNGYTIGYNFSSSQAIFTFGSVTETPGTNLKGQKTDDYLSRNLNVTANVTNNSGSIFSGGSFMPGVSVNYEWVWNSDALRQKAYWFFRPFYSIQQNSFGSVDAVADTIKIVKNLNHAFGATGGVNFVWGKKKSAILALSGVLAYNIHPVDELKTETYSTDYVAAHNGIVQNTTVAYSSTQQDYFSVTPKVDFVYSPWIIKDGKGAEVSRIGFISALSGLYNARENRMAASFAIGPSLHPAYLTNSVISALMFEFTDFTNTTGKKLFRDRFSINFYVGIPISLK